MKMVFDEWYGELPAKLLRLVKKHNVSPADYQDLEDLCENDFDLMAKAIVDCSQNGCFSSYEFWQKY